MDILNFMIKNILIVMICYEKFMGPFVINPELVNKEFYLVSHLLI